MWNTEKQDKESDIVRQQTSNKSEESDWRTEPEQEREERSGERAIWMTVED